MVSKFPDSTVSSFLKTSLKEKRVLTMDGQSPFCFEAKWKDWESCNKSTSNLRNTDSRIARFGHGATCCFKRKSSETQDNKHIIPNGKHIVVVFLPYKSGNIREWTINLSVNKREIKCKTICTKSSSLTKAASCTGQNLHENGKKTEKPRWSSCSPNLRTIWN